MAKDHSTQMHPYRLVQSNNAISGEIMEGLLIINPRWNARVHFYSIPFYSAFDQPMSKF